MVSRFLIVVLFSLLFSLSHSQAIEWSTLNATTLATLTPSNFSTINSTDLGSIPADACVSFSAAQIQAIPPLAITGLTSSQIESIPALAFQGFNASHSSEFLSPICSSFSSSQLANLSASAVGGISPACITGFPSLAAWGQAQLLALSNATIEALISVQLLTVQWNYVTSAFISNMANGTCTIFNSTIASKLNYALYPLSQLTADCLSLIPPSGISVLSTSNAPTFTSIPSSALAGLTADQVGVLSFSVMGSGKLPYINPSACSGINSYTWTTLSYASIIYLTPSCVATITNLTGITSYQLQSFNSSAYAVFTPEAISSIANNTNSAWTPTMLSALNPLACAAFGVNQVQYISAASYAGLQPACVENIPASSLSLLQTSSLSYFPSASRQALSADQLGALPYTSLQNLNVFDFNPEECYGWNSNLFNGLTSTATLDITAQCFQILPDSALATIRTNLVASFSSDVVASWNYSTFNTVPNIMTGISSYQAGLLTTDQCTDLSNLLVQVNSMPATSFRALNPGCIPIFGPNLFQNAPAAQLSALTSTQIVQITPDQLDVMPNSLITSFSLTQLSSFTPSQISSLENGKLAFLVTHYNDSFVDLYTVDEFSGVDTYHMALFKTLIPQYLYPSINYLDLNWKVTTWIQLALTNPFPAPQFDQTFLLSVAPSTFGGLRADQVSTMPPESLSVLSPAMAYYLAEDSARGLTADQVYYISPAAFANISETSLSNFNVTTWSNVQPHQLSSIRYSYWSNAPCSVFSAFYKDQLSDLSGQQSDSFNEAAKVCDPKYKPLPTSSTSGSNNTEKHDLSKTEIGLIAAVAVLGVTLIVVVAVLLARRGRGGYDNIGR